MKSFKSYVTAGVGFAMLVTIIFLATGWGSAVAAQVTSVFVNNDTAHPVPVHEQGTATVHVNNFPATVQISQPANTFVAHNGWSGVIAAFQVPAGPDPAGTRYAISSVTLASTGSDNSTVILSTGHANGPGCVFDNEQTLLTLAAPAHDSASASFPQPMVSDATSDAVCLEVTGGGSGDVTVVGYKTQ
jgi:hypothetical protein